MRTLSSLIGREIVTDTGRRLGECHDIRGELTSSSLRVTGLVVGTRGWLEHYGIGAQASASQVRLKEKDTVPWDAILKIEATQIVVRDDTAPP